MNKLKAIEKYVPKKLAYICTVLNLFTFFLKILMVHIIKIIFDSIADHRTENLYWNILLFTGTALSVRGLNYLNSCTANEFSFQFMSKLHTAFYSSILYMEIPNAQSEFTASVAQRHLPRIEDFVPLKYIDRNVEIIRLIMALAYIGYVSWQLLLFSMTIFPVVLIITGTLGGKIEGLNKSILNNHKDLDNMYMEALDGAESVRIQNARSFLQKMFSEKLEKAYQKEKELEKKLKMVNEPLLAISSFLLNIISIFWSGMLSYWGIMSIGSVISFIGFYSNIINPIMFFMNYSVSNKSVNPSLDVINDILNHKYENNNSESIQEIKNEMPFKNIIAVEMSNVCFSYNENKPILNRFSLKAEEACIISVRGKSGTGKSTILDLICGFHDAYQGEIYYWGNSNKECSIVEIRKKIGYVSQNPFFFNESILSNMSYVKDKITEEDLVAINQECYGLFDDLADYYHKPIGLFGEFLSGGMKQKLDIMRLLLSDSDIYIMDEPASALDAVARNKLIEVLKKKKQSGKAIILVTHQDSIGDLADREYSVQYQGNREENGVCE